jgi:hypothetical protein
MECMGTEHSAEPDQDCWRNFMLGGEVERREGDTIWLRTTTIAAVNALGRVCALGTGRCRVQLQWEQLRPSDPKPGIFEAGVYAPASVQEDRLASDYAKDIQFPPQQTGILGAGTWDWPQNQERRDAVVDRLPWWRRAMLGAYGKIQQARRAVDRAIVQEDTSVDTEPSEHGNVR